MVSIHSRPRTFATHVLGPQPSLDLIGLAQLAVFFGDETSFAAAKTLQSHLSPQHATRLLFEVSSVVEAQAVGDHLDLRDAQYLERRSIDAASPLLTEAIHRELASLATPHLILSGNGSSIQAIRTILRANPSVVITYRTKAYWAPGKTGLE